MLRIVTNRPPIARMISIVVSRFSNIRFDITHL